MTSIWSPPEDTLTEPDFYDRVPLTLVYERGDGSRVEYETDSHHAWRHEYDAYTLLGACFETYDDAGGCYFILRNES